MQNYLSYHANLRCASLQTFVHMSTQWVVNVLLEHDPTIGDIISSRYWKVMFKIPKKRQLPTPCDMPQISPQQGHYVACTSPPNTPNHPTQGQEHIRSF